MLPAAAGGIALWLLSEPAQLFSDFYKAYYPTAEMLLQSDDPYGTPTSLSAVQSGEAGFLHLLPALPSALPSGKVSGLLARGVRRADEAERAVRRRG